MRIFKYNGSFLSILILTGATISFIIFLLIKLLPLIFAKTFYFCQKFISWTFLQIPHSLQNTLLFIFIIALTLGILSFLLQVIKTKQLVKALIKKRITITPKVEKIIASLGFKNDVYIIKDASYFSFCVGVFNPRILITTGLIETLTNRELESVFLHEKAHIQNMDPFKMLFGKTISWLFFFLPIFSELNKNMQATSEILADRFATSFQGDDIYLRTALKKILITPQINFAFTSEIANPDYLEIRIKKLINPALTNSFRISWMSIFTSILFMFFIMFLIQTQVSAFHIENSKEQAYSICTSNNSCSRQCQSALQTSNASTPQQLFSPIQKEQNSLSAPFKILKSQPFKYN